MVLSVLLGHSTWHLYRKVIERNPNLPEMPPRTKIRRCAADFPSRCFSRAATTSSCPTWIRSLLRHRFRCWHIPEVPPA
jgi:hypothetical protein